MAAYRYARLRYGRRMSSKEKAGLAAAALVILTGAAPGAASAMHGADPASVAAAPAGSGYTPQTWAAAFLAMIGEPQTPCNLAAITGWEAAEGGAWGNAASFNPLNTARPEPGSWAINGDHVQAYPSWQAGFEGNAAAITNGLYGGILAALRAGNNAQAVADAVGSSHWGTSWFGVSC